MLPTISDEYPKQKNSQPSNLLVNANEFFAAMDLFAKFYPTWNQLVVVNLTKTKIKIQENPWNFFESVDMLNPKTRWQNLQKSNEAKDSSAQIILKRWFVLNLTHQRQKSKSLMINSLKVSKCSMREQNICQQRTKTRVQSPWRNPIWVKPIYKIWITKPDEKLKKVISSDTAWNQWRKIW